MRKKKVVLGKSVLLIIAIFALFLATCGGDDLNDDDYYQGYRHDIDSVLYGSWKTSSDPLLAVKFSTGGIRWSGPDVGFYNGLSIRKWTAKNGKIEADYHGMTTSIYNYSINYNGELVLSSSNPSATHTLTKVTWTEVTMDNTFYNGSSINAIAYGNGRWVAVGYYGEMATSTDGETWTEVTDDTFYYGSSINAIAYGNGRWVAGGDGGKMATSTDGINWTEVTDNTFDDTYYGNINAIAYGNGRWVAVGSGVKIVTSTNGTNWAEVTDNTFDSYYGSSINAIAYGNNRWVAVGGNGKMATSTDGETWTEVTDTDNIFDISYYGNSINAIAYDGNGRWVAGGNGGKMATSTDGETWIKVTDSKFGDNHISAIAYGNGKWVVVGNSSYSSDYGIYYNRMAISTDGTNWTDVTNSTIYNFPIKAIIAYGNGRWLVAGSRYIAYLDD